jgi:hypothetical protein
MSKPDVIAISASPSNLDVATEYEYELLEEGYRVNWTINPHTLEDLTTEPGEELPLGDLRDVLGDPQVMRNRLRIIAQADVVLGVNEGRWGGQVCHVPSMTEYDLVFGAMTGTLPLLSETFPQNARKGGPADLARRVNMSVLGIQPLQGDMGRIAIALRKHRGSPNLPDAREYVQLLQLEQGEQ